MKIYVLFQYSLLAEPKLCTSLHYLELKTYNNMKFYNMIDELSSEYSIKIYDDVRVLRIPRFIFKKRKWPFIKPRMPISSRE